MRLRMAIPCGLLLVLILAGPARAYLDPGSGSYLLQVALAGLFGALFALKLYWQRLRGFFSRWFTKKP